MEENEEDKEEMMDVDSDLDKDPSERQFVFDQGTGHHGGGQREETISVATSKSRQYR